MIRVSVAVLALAASAPSALFATAHHSLDLRKAKTSSLLFAQRNEMVVSNAQDVRSDDIRLTDLPAGATDLDALAVGDALSVRLFEDVEVTLTLTERTASPLGGACFLATVSGYEGVQNAVVVQTGDGLQIDIQDYRNGKVYSVFSSGAGVRVKERGGARKARTCQTLEVPKPATAAASGIDVSSSLKSSAMANASADVTHVDILVVYDTLASEWVSDNGGATNFAEVAVQKMNTALANTGLDRRFRFRLVGVREVEGRGARYHYDGSTLHGILQSYQYPGVTFNGYKWSQIKTMRDEVGADIVCILTDTGYSWGVTGNGYSLDSSGAAHMRVRTRGRKIPKDV